MLNHGGRITARGTRAPFPLGLPTRVPPHVRPPRLVQLRYVTPRVLKLWPVEMGPCDFAAVVNWTAFKLRSQFEGFRFILDWILIN